MAGMVRKVLGAALQGAGQGIVERAAAIRQNTLMHLQREWNVEDREARADLTREGWDRQDRRAVISASGAATRPTETFETVESPFGRGGVGQRSTTTGKVVNYQSPPGASGSGKPDKYINVYDPNAPASGKAVIEGSDEHRSLMAQGYLMGKPARAEKPSADEAKAGGFADRLFLAEGALMGTGEGGDPLDMMGLQMKGNVLESVPFGNYLQDPRYQQYEQAKRNFVNATLRRESGAAIADHEFDSANLQYFPMPGDGPEVIAQKRQNRREVIRGMIRSAGRTYERTLDELDAGGSGGAGGGAPAAGGSRFDGMSAQQLQGVDVESLSDEELDAFEMAARAAGLI